MAYEIKNGQGSLFVNKNRTGQQPNMTGSIVAHRDIKAGETVRLAAWTNTPKAGVEFFFLKMSDPMSRGDNAPKASATPPKATPQDTGEFEMEDDLDDEIPFS